MENWLPSKQFIWVQVPLFVPCLFGEMVNTKDLKSFFFLNYWFKSNNKQIFFYYDNNNKIEIWRL